MGMFTGSLEQASNRAQWIGQVDVTDADTGDYADISGASAITLEIVDPSSCRPVLTASLANGKITLPDTGLIQWAFTKEDMGVLRPVTHSAAMTMTLGGSTVQLMIARLPVLEGFIR